MVLQELDAELGRAEAHHRLLLAQAARDVASLCQSIYETFPGLEQSVPVFEGTSLSPCSLRPAEMLELHVRTPMFLTEQSATRWQWDSLACSLTCGCAFRLRLCWRANFST